ncbi:MAG: GxxExxY protein [Chlorobi bacterium]|nr:GxxExxY protein [Chlorobiota bacterium]
MTHSCLKDLNSITEQIIGAGFRVSNQLGCGFREKIYERALELELRATNLHVERQKKINIEYRNVLVGNFVADIVVEDSVLVELKTVKELDDTHLAQALNYLRVTQLPICLLLNFSYQKVQIKRITL